MTAFTPALLSRAIPTVQRRHLFTSLMVAAVANSFAHTITRAVGEHGLLGALSNGLGMSWAFWIAWVLGARLALTAAPTSASRADFAVAGACLLLVLLPVQALSGVASTLLAGWFLWTAREEPRLRAAALILMAIAVSVFWSQIVMMLFNRPVASFDSWWVDLLSPAEIDGAYVRFVEGGKGFVLFPGCTSVSNASLAVLIWIAIVRTFRPEGIRHEWLAAIGVFFTVVLINGARLALMAQNRSAFDYWHTGTGSGIITAVITLAGIAWAVAGVRREIFR